MATYTTVMARQQPYSRTEIGKFVWCRYWQHWSLVIDVSASGEVTEQDTDGERIGNVRSHSTPHGRGDIISDEMFTITREHIL